MLAAGDVFKKTKNSTQHRGIAHYLNPCERKSKWCMEITDAVIYSLATDFGGNNGKGRLQAAG